MKWYISAIVCVTFTSIKLCFTKLLHFKNLKFYFIEIFSPFTEISLSKKATLLLGKKVKLKSGSKLRVRRNGTMKIGDDVSLNNNCVFTCYENIHINNGVQFGPNVLIYDHDHDFRQKDGMKDLKYKTSPIEIGENTWIGANTVILRGTKIGKNCVVGAGSVIKGEYPDHSIIIQRRQTDVISYEFDRRP